VFASGQLKNAQAYSPVYKRRQAVSFVSAVNEALGHVAFLLYEYSA
jgi:hypothetical protein